MLRAVLQLRSRWGTTKLRVPTGGPGVQLSRRSNLRKIKVRSTKTLRCLFTDKSLEVETSKDVSPVSPGNIAQALVVVVPGVGHSQIKPATLDELQHKFADTTMLRNKPADWTEDATPAHTTPLDPEHAARDALIVAYSEREASRVELNTNYTRDCALGFDEKARAYKMRRQALAALMPLGQLSRDDVESFPYLSSKDTLEPKVRYSTVSFSQRLS
jgi:hypothetical protein